MLLEIYQSMLETASNGKVPKYVELCYYIDKEETKNFWSDGNKSGEKQMIFDEWETMGGSRYRRRLYGIWFVIQFSYEERK